MGETNKVGANTKTSTAAGGYTHARHVGVQNAKGGSGGESNKRNLVQVQGAFRDGKGRESNHKTFNEIFDCALEKFTKVESFNMEHL